jgi:group I intron endonuclease
MIVYLIRNSINGKGYIGQSMYDLEHRWKEHISDARNNSKLAFHCAIRKYGQDAFERTVLATLSDNSTRNELDKLEIDLIEKYKTFGISNGIRLGYNLTPGGQFGGCCLSGRVVSKETREKLSLSRKGKKLSKEHCETIGKSIRKFYEFNKGPNNGKSWSENEKNKHSVLRFYKKKPVFGLNEVGICVVMYFSIDDAIIETGLKFRVLCGNRKKQKFINGITYKRSKMTISELKENFTLNNECHYGF